MAVVRDKTAPVNTGTGSGTRTSTFATNPAAGDKVILAVWCYSTTAPSSVTDNASNAYTQDKSFTGNSGDANLVVRLYRADNIALPGAGTLAVSAALPADGTVCAIAYSGVATGAPTASNTNFSASTQTGGNSAAAGGANTGLQVGVQCFFGTINPENIATTAPFSQQGAENDGNSFLPGAVSDQLNAGATGTATWTWTTSSRWSALIVAYDSAAPAAVIVAPLPVRPPGRISPTGLWSPIQGSTEFTLDTAAVPALPSTGIGSGPDSVATAGTATVTAMAAATQANPGAQAATGTASATAAVGGALGAGPTAAVTATTLQAATPAGASALPGSTSTTGTATVAAPPASTLGGGGAISVTGATSIAPPATAAVGTGGLTDATATTLQATLAAKAGAQPGSVTATGAATAATVPTPAVGTAGSVSISGAAALLSLPTPAIAAGTGTFATATTLQATSPARAGSGPCATTLTAAASQVGSPTGAGGVGGTPSPTGVGNTSAFPGMGLGAAGGQTVGIAVISVIGGGSGRGGAQAVTEQLVTRGSLQPIDRPSSVMNPLDRTGPTMSGVTDG